MNEFKFRPTKTYATADNARKAIVALAGAHCPDRFMVVEHVGRFAPVVISSEQPGFYSLNGFTVVG